MKSYISNRLITPVFPVLAKPDVEKVIVYTPRGGERETYFTGSFGKAVLRIQIDIYSKSFIGNQTVYDAMVNKFNGFSGELNNSTIVHRAIVTNHSELLDSNDSELFRTSFDVELTY